METWQRQKARLTDVCGQKHNVSYSLAVHGSNVMVIKARGWTGSCEPNMFDEMSAKLAESFALAPAGQAVPPAVAAPVPSD